LRYQLIIGMVGMVSWAGLIRTNSDIAARPLFRHRARLCAGGSLNGLTTSLRNLVSPSREAKARCEKSQPERQNQEEEETPFVISMLLRLTLESNSVRFAAPLTLILAAVHLAQRQKSTRPKT